mgnify:CR=1 FL=1
MRDPECDDHKGHDGSVLPVGQDQQTRLVVPSEKRDELFDSDAGFADQCAQSSRRKLSMVGHDQPPIWRARVS